MQRNNLNRTQYTPKSALEIKIQGLLRGQKEQLGLLDTASFAPEPNPVFAPDAAFAAELQCELEKYANDILNTLAPLNFKDPEENQELLRERLSDLLGVSRTPSASDSELLSPVISSTGLSTSSSASVAENTPLPFPSALRKRSREDNELTMANEGPSRQIKKVRFEENAVRASAKARMRKARTERALKARFFPSYHVDSVTVGSFEMHEQHHVVNRYNEISQQGGDHATQTWEKYIVHAYQTGRSFRLFGINEYKNDAASNVETTYCSLYTDKQGNRFFENYDTGAKTVTIVTEAEAKDTAEMLLTIAKENADHNQRLVEVTKQAQDEHLNKARRNLPLRK